MGWNDREGRLSLAALAVLAGLACASPTRAEEERPVRLVFEAATEGDRAAAAEYEAIWASDGQRIVAALEERSGLPFEETDIRVVVVEAPSSSGWGERPMRMRTSYATNTKKGTLVHELGHRLHGRYFRKGEEDHPYLFLYLYDVWVALYGKAFADEQVKVESARRGSYDYETVWREALALGADERLAKWRAFVASRQRESKEAT
jgi:hypothetical protein